VAYTTHASINGGLLKIHAPREHGTFVRVNHDECGDAKNRLWVQRNADGSIVGYCHNCGARGYTVGFSRGKPRVDVDVKKAERTLPLAPEELIYETDKWPAAARGWLLQYSTLPSEVGAAWATGYDRLALPIKNPDGDLVGHNLRSVDGRLPKYLTRGDPHLGHWVAGVPGTGLVVLVEDIISATKVGRIAPAVALLRTSLNGDTLAELTKRYAHGIVSVWMDPDTAGRQAARKIIDQTSLLMDTRNLDAPRQPKESTDAEIKEMLKL